MQAKGTDEEARAELSRLAVRHHGAIFGYCRRRLGTDAEADDALQETFLRAHRYWASFDQSREARKWLFGIAHNVCVEIARARGRSRTMEEFPDPADERGSTTLALERIAREEHMAAVRNELARMPDRARRVLELKFFGQLNGKEIAELEGMTEAAVRVTVHRALEALRAKLGKIEE